MGIYSSLIQLNGSKPGERHVINLIGVRLVYGYGWFLCCWKSFYCNKFVLQNVFIHP